MARYLLEVGCEEIPARMIDGAIRDLSEALRNRLRTEALEPTGEPRSFAGPRRLAVVLDGVPERQPDRTERLLGPPVERAFDATGAPTKAALGFAAKLGIDPAALEREATPKGLVVAGTKHTPGQSAAQVLARVVPETLAGLSFPKLMRWGSHDARFVRAVRWIVSLLDQEVVAFEFIGVRAGRASRGHRFLAGSEPLLLAGADAYEEPLRQAHVIVDAAERRETIRRALRQASAARGGEYVEDEELLAEVSQLVEEPHVIAGDFAAPFLELPEEVLITSMRHHQKSFPMRTTTDRKLLPAFLSIANVPDTASNIKRGYERVLNARLADARFFWSEDRKQELASRGAKLAKVVFHERLGSYATKLERLALLVEPVALGLGLGAQAAAARAAAQLCKSDLVTGMVGEFPELQGVVGGLLLTAEGASPEVARAVYEHYLPTSLEGALPRTPAGAVLSMADKLDTLVGFFGAGLLPSGTKDPFGLRRAAQGVVKIALDRGHDVDLEPLLEAAARLHRELPGAKAASERLGELSTYLAERIEFVLKTQGHRPDTLDCVLAVRPLAVVSASRRAAELSQARETAGFDEVFTALKRVANIAGTEGESAYDRAALREPAERELASRLEALVRPLGEALKRGAYAELLAGVRGLKEPLEDFFTNVLVMDPDPGVRENRLRLLRSVGSLAAPVGDFRRLQVEREKRKA